MQNSPLESSCVVVALKENYNTSKFLKFSPEESQTSICDTVVANERNVKYGDHIKTIIIETGIGSRYIIVEPGRVHSTSVGSFSHIL